MTDEIWPRGENSAPSKEAVEFIADLVSSVARDPAVNTNELRRALGGAELLGSRCEDTSNSERFAATYGDVVRFAWRPGIWLTWEGRRWCAHADGRVTESAKNVARNIYNEVAGLDGKDERKKMAHWAEQSMCSNRIAAMLQLAKSDPRIRVENFSDAFDTHPLLVNFLNGTFDVATGKLWEHRKEDFITKLVHYRYDPFATCPLWRKFIAETFGDLAEFIQKAAGYSITGNVSEKVAFLLIGPTNGGKTTYLSAQQEIFTEYSTHLQIETLMQNRVEDNNTQADLADLRGARLAITSETEEGHRLREAKLKRIVQGTGKIKAVRKYENPFEFPETHKLWIDCNHHPIVHGNDDSIWGRFVTIPCNHRVSGEELDRDLKRKLLAEAEGIVAWAIDGALLWKAEGLGQPQLVLETREQWRASMDRFGEWLEECTVTGPEQWESTQELYGSYKRWAEERGQAPLSDTTFGTRLVDRGFYSERRRDGGTKKRGYRGLRLRQLGEMAESG